MREVRRTMHGRALEISVVAWLPANRDLWGALLQTAFSTTNALNEDDVQKLLSAFRAGHILHLISTRFEGHSYAHAANIKEDIEAGRGERFGIADVGPTFNPNTDNVNLSEDANDQKARDDRWLLVWQAMARQAKTSGGKMIQIVEKSKGLSQMQQAEENYAKLLGLEVHRVEV